MSISPVSHLLVKIHFGISLCFFHFLKVSLIICFFVFRFSFARNVILCYFDTLLWVLIPFLCPFCCMWSWLDSILDSTLAYQATSLSSQPLHSIGKLVTGRRSWSQDLEVKRRLIYTDIQCIYSQIYNRK